jgi:hypothetical protein
LEGLLLKKKDRLYKEITQKQQTIREIEEFIQTGQEE